MRNTTFLLLFFCTVCVYGQRKNINSQEDDRPFVLGTITQIQSMILGEKRILNIYLPEGYDENRSVKYPVIYLLDGSADEDFIHFTGLVQYNSFEWVNRVPKCIVVGIATVDRRRDFTFPTQIAEDVKRYPTAGHSDRFMRFIGEELQPFIAKKYRISEDRTIAGQSLGGLFATEILLKKPALFNRYIIVSPSIWWDNGSLLDQPTTLLSNLLRPTEVYIGVGKEGLTPTAVPRVMEVDANLLAEKLRNAKSKFLNVHFDYLPAEDHATIMHQAVSNAFQMIYQKPETE